MLNRIQSQKRPDRNWLLTEVSQRLEPVRLVHLVWEAQQAVDLETQRWIDQFPSQNPMPLRILLTLLTFCYASGVFSSAEIEQRCQTDPICRYICAQHVPTRDQIRRFRRAHRLLLRQSLVRLLELKSEPAAFVPGRPAKGKRLEIGDSFVSSRFENRFCDSAEPLPDLDGKAESWLRRAAQLDSMALDD